MASDGAFGCVTAPSRARGLIRAATVRERCCSSRPQAPLPYGRGSDTDTSRAPKIEEFLLRRQNRGTQSALCYNDAPKGAVKIVDAHAHLGLDEVFDEDFTAEELIAAQKQCGIDITQH